MIDWNAVRDEVTTYLQELIRIDTTNPPGNETQAARRRYATVTASVFDHQSQLYLDMGFDDFLDKPLRAEQIYAYLSEHLGVAYTLAEEAGDLAKSAVDWTDMVLPADLYANLSSAIKGHSVTKLRQHLGELARLGGKGQGLAAHLGELAQQYDMNGVRAVLEGIEHE